MTVEEPVQSEGDWTASGNSYSLDKRPGVSQVKRVLHNPIAYDLRGPKCQSQDVQSVSDHEYTIAVCQPKQPRHPGPNHFESYNSDIIKNGGPIRGFSES